MKPIQRRKFLEKGAGLVGVPFLAQAAGPGSAGTNQKISPELEKILAELESTQARFYNVPRRDGEFLNLMAKAIQCKRVLEIGTANGYSAIWLSLALEETRGNLQTIEINPALVQAARKNLERAGLSHRVKFHQGDAHEVVTQLEGVFDFIFIDAELGGKMDYFRKIHPGKIQPGGLIIVHNVIRYRSAMEDYLEFIKKHPEYDSVILSLTMDDGFCVSYRKREK